MQPFEIPTGATPLGYKKLTEIFNLEVIPHHCWSYASLKREKSEVYLKDQNLTLHIYPSSYKLSENSFEHLEFALKYEGVNLFILKKVLMQILPSEISSYIKTKPTGKYVRILWYLYEYFNHKELPLPDLIQGTYVLLLDPKQYYCSKKPQRSARHRIANNLLGTLSFAPMVRKTKLLIEYNKNEIQKKADKLAKQYDPGVFARAISYLYTKETMSSWEIEREKPDKARLTKFVGLLHKADSIGVLSEEMLVKLQKNIIDPRFALMEYRDFQNYVGEEPGMGRLTIHYISPRPENVRDLMNDLIYSYHIIEESEIDPVVAASILSFLFVYIHPFEDGNGRIHRFLIHYTLARMKFTLEGVVFPISAVILRDVLYYDRILESFSKPLMELITAYNVNDKGEMRVIQETSDFYRYIDLTMAAEYLYECVEKTITTDFQDELSFLAAYDAIKQRCKDIVDMPDQRIDLFIKCVRQNGGVLSERKRENYFNMLQDAEIKIMEGVINHYLK